MCIVMMGTGVFAEPTFAALVAAGETVVGLFTQPDRDVGRRTGASRQTGVGMKTLADTHGIPVFQPESINTPEGLASLQSLNADLCVVAAYGQILKPDVIATPRLGMINVHASLLPRYRGAAPINYAIWRGESHSGVTIIRITPGLDSGDMLAQESLEILPEETTGELEARLAPLGARLCMDVVQRMKQGHVEGKKQDPTLVTKAPKITKEMGLIDWTQPAAIVACQVRAMQPWPSPFTFYHRPGKEPMRLIVNRVKPLTESSDASATPGQILSEGGERLVVACGAGQSVEILELQPAGKKRMPVQEFLRGYAARRSDRFGSA